MSHHPSPQSPPDDEPSPSVARHLISPQERFASPTEAEIEPQFEPEDPFQPEDSFEAQFSARRRDEMARRHLPPRERARQDRAPRDRARVGREKRQIGATQNSSDALAPETISHARRARAERDFTRAARENPPTAPPKTRRRAPMWLKRLLALALLLFAAQLGFAALTAPQFEVETVEIRGIGATPQADLQPLARALIGQNLVRLNTRATEKAVASLPTVASAKVVRLAQWPPKVALEIRERAPFLLVGAGNNWWVVDPKGMPFRRPNAENAADAALYQVVAPGFEPQLGQSLNPKIWARALALEKALEADNRLASRVQTGAKSGENARFWQLRRIYFDRDGLASLRLSRSPHREMLLRLGDDAFPEKLVRARESLAYFERTMRQASELDLVSLQRPVWTPKQTPISAPRIVQNGEKTVAEMG